MGSNCQLCALQWRRSTSAHRRCVIVGSQRFTKQAQRSTESVETFSPFEIGVQLLDYSFLEPVLVSHVYRASVKGQVPLHPVSMHQLSLYRRAGNLSRHEVLRTSRHPADGQTLRQCAGFGDDIRGESSLRYFEGQLTPELQREVNVLQ